jgi:heme/copper-type cytochrome/quinol oxidase subunit 2
MDILFTLLFLLFMVMIFIIPAFVLLVLGLAVKAVYDIRKSNNDL